MEVIVDPNGAPRDVSTREPEDADTRTEHGDTLMVTPVVAGR